MDTDLIHEHVVDLDRRHHVVAVIARVLDYAFGVLYAVLAIRLALVFFEAQPHAGFFQFIRNATQPFYAPFHGLFATSLVLQHPVEWSLVVAMIGYALLHGGIRALLRLVAR
jgi:uncharacterized protein YggT (Ycf19 family)